MKNLQLSITSVFSKKHNYFSKVSLLLVLLLVLWSCSKKEDEKFVPNNELSVKIAKWKGNKKAAITIEFDDSTPGQAQLGVPALISRNMIGTWYVNPGREYFLENINTWETIAPEGKQELANHTMNHSGATTYEEVVFEVGEASKKIWEIRGEENFASLIAFNRGGGTSWNETDLQNVLDEYKNIDRLSYIGITAKALSVPSGSNANEMFAMVSDVVKDSIIGRHHFHGISAENGNPPMDSGNAGVWINEFNAFLDKLNAIKDDIWIAGYIQLYKYIKERQTAIISIEQTSNEKCIIKLTSSMDPAYYDQRLTIIASIPGEWTNCTISHEGNSQKFPVSNGIVIFNAKPNKGDIVITKEL